MKTPTSYYYGDDNNNLKMFSTPQQSPLPGDNTPEMLTNSHTLYCPEPTLSEKVFLELERLAAIAEAETGNIKGTDMHFETCRVNLIEEVNKGNIEFLSDELKVNCPENSQCQKCIEAFNVAIGSNNTEQYASEGPEMYEDLCTRQDLI